MNSLDWMLTVGQGPLRRWARRSGVLVSVTVVVSSSLFGGAPAGSAGQVARSVSRIVCRQPGVPLEQLASESDQILEVRECGSDPPFEVPWAPIRDRQAALRRLRHVEASAVIGRVTSVTFKPAFRGEFLTTEIELVVEETVVRSRQLVASLPTTIVVERLGGEIQRGATLIRAVGDTRKGFVPGHRYVVFFGSDPAEEPVQDFASWEIGADDRLVDMRAAPGGDEWTQWITGMNLRVFARSVRKGRR